MSKTTLTPVILFTALSLLLAASGAWSGVRAQLDRDRIYDGDTLTLTIEATGPHKDERPDLSVLEPDFRVLGTGSGTQIQIVNGLRSDTQHWTIILEPKRIGELRVPPIQLGPAKTRPLTLQVIEIPVQDTAGKQAELFIEVEPDAASGFVQQQIPITVRLFSAVPIREGVLTEPRVENARVEQLGDSRRYTAERKGRLYQVIERRYAVFPERSGKLRIPPVVFRGSVISRRGDGSGGDSLLERLHRDQLFPRAFSDPMLDRLFNDDFFQSPFGSREPGKRISARSRGLDIEIKPRPDDYDGDHWLPARKLTLEDSWAEDPPVFRVGEPVTRTITIRAHGAEGAQMPPLNLESTAGLRLYPEQPVSETRTDGKQVFGISRQSVAMVAKQAGPLVIPEIKVHWWDTVAQRERTASIPPWRVTAEPGSGAVAPQERVPAAPPQTSQSTAQNAGGPKPAEPAHQEQTPPSNPAGPQSLWLWLGRVGVLLLAALGGWLLWRRRRTRASDATPGEAHPTRHAARKEYRAVQDFRRACQTNNPEDAASSLLDWAAETWPDHPPRSLGAVAARVSQGADLIRELDRSLYASDAAQWQGKTLWDALQGGLAADAHSCGAKRNTPDLPPLYPKHG